LQKKGVKLNAIYYCPHLPDAGCACRKPKLGLVEKARKAFRLDLGRCYSVGDHHGDYKLGQAMGGKGVFVLTGHGKKEQAMINPQGPRPDRIEKNMLGAARWILKDSSTHHLHEKQ
jgi:histidinol phosphatase-like enzyme